MGEPTGACRRGICAVALAAVTVLIVAVASLHEPARGLAVAAPAQLAALLSPLLRRSAELMQLAGVRAPALAIGVGVAVLTIPVAVLAGLLRWALREPGLAGNTARTAPARTPTPTRLDEITGFARPRRAWVEGKLDGTAFMRDLKPGLTRIGRESDNEISLSCVRRLERYHAAIEHTREHDIYVCDLTKGAKGQVRVNGRRAARKRLRSGDRVTCPGVDLTFHTSST